MKSVRVGVVVLLCAWGTIQAQQWEPIPGAIGLIPDMSMDSQGNVHLVLSRDTGSVRYMRFDALSGSWGNMIVLPYSGDLWELFGRPKVDVGPNGIPHVAWGTQGLTYLMHAWANSPSPDSTQDWSVEFIGPDWVAFPDIAVDEQNNPHFVFQRVTHNPDTWHLVYRDPWGNETDIQATSNEPYKPNFPAIECGGGLVHVAWEKGDGNHGNIYYANSSDWWHPIALSSTWDYQHPTFPHLSICPTTGSPGVVFFVDDWSAGSHGYHQGVYFSQPGGAFQEQLWSCNAWLWEPRTAYNDDWYPQIGYDSQGTRYVVWTVYDLGKTYYKEGEQAVTELATAGHIAVAAGTNGARMVRCVPSGGPLQTAAFGGGPVYYPPTAQIDDISPDPAYQQQDVVHFEGSAWDNDEGGQSITAYEWRSDRDGVLATTEDFTRSADLLSVGQHIITFKVWDDENQTDQATGTLTVSLLWDPTAQIDSIVPNPAAQQVDVVHFEGSAWDNDEGAQSIVGYEWSSSLDGALATTEDFDRPANDLTPGAHLITFAVVDDDNQTAEDTLTLVITPPPLPPTAVIDDITPNPATQDVDIVAFYGSAWDNDENGQSIVSYRWTSSINGILSNQEDFWRAASSLSAGAHLITFKVWDDEGQTAQDTVTLVIQPSPFQPPTAVIDSIVPGSAYYGIDTVSFYGSAWDNDEQGDSIEAYLWSSSLDGSLATVADFVLPADSLSTGKHLITFKVWDDEQQTGQDTMTIVVLNPGSAPPTAVIDSIWPSPAMHQRDTISFCGSAWDNDPTDMIETYEWWSERLQDVLSTEEDFRLPADSLPLGLNAIRFTAWDDEGDSAAAWGSVSVVEYTPVPPVPQALACEYEAEQNRIKLTWIGSLGVTFNVYHGSLAYFIGVDPVASDLTSPPWYHDDPDLSRAHFYYVTSENIGGESEPSGRVGLVPYDTANPPGSP